MKQPKPPSQNAIGRTLGLSSSNMTKLKKQGCPMDSVESVRAWRLENQNIAQRKPDPPSTPPQRSPEALSARAMIDAAALMINAGQDIDAMVPALRAALAAVPPHARDLVGLDLNVMKRLLRGVLDAIPPRSENPCDEDGATIYMAEPMSDADALEAGKFWYQVAAGEFFIDVEALRQRFPRIHAGVVSSCTLDDAAAVPGGGSHREDRAPRSDNARLGLTGETGVLAPEKNKVLLGAQSGGYSHRVDGLLRGAPKGGMA